MPVGFAGGLTDPDTGFVRFGWRDYDPAVGRFTAPDPLGDTGGDHDLYEYCVDDPVSRVDPAGLFWFVPALYATLVGAAESSPFLFGIAGGAAGFGLGMGVSHLAAAGVDTAETIRSGKEFTKARDGMRAITPLAAKIQAVAQTPLAAAALAQAVGPVVSAVGRQAGTAFSTTAQRAGSVANAAWQRVGPAIMGAAAAATGAATPITPLEKAVHYGAEILKGYNIPSPPSGASFLEGVGAMAKWIKEEYQREQNKLPRGR